MQFGLSVVFGTEQVQLIRGKMLKAFPQRLEWDILSMVKTCSDIEEKLLELQNVSNSTVKVRIKPPNTKYFSVKGGIKEHVLSPGLKVKIMVYFHVYLFKENGPANCPRNVIENWCIQTENEPLYIELAASIFSSSLSVPSVIKLGKVIVNRKVLETINIQNKGLSIGRFFIDVQNDKILEPLVNNAILVDHKIEISPLSGRIQPHSSQTVDLEFTPLKLGLVTSLLQISLNDDNAVVVIEAEVHDHNIHLNSASIEFGEVFLGSKLQKFLVVFNDGPKHATIAIKAPSHPFSCELDEETIILEPYEKLKTRIHFHPISDAKNEFKSIDNHETRASQDKLYFYCKETEQSFTIFLSGRAVSLIFDVLPDSLSFNPKDIKLFTIFNKSSILPITYKISKVPGVFIVDKKGLKLSESFSGRIMSGGLKDIYLQYIPTRIGKVSDKVCIDLNNGMKQVYVLISSQTSNQSKRFPAPSLEVQQQVVDFESVPHYTYTPADLKLKKLHTKQYNDLLILARKKRKILERFKAYIKGKRTSDRYYNGLKEPGLNILSSNLEQPL